MRIIYFLVMFLMMGSFVACTSNEQKEVESIENTYEEQPELIFEHDKDSLAYTYKEIYKEYVIDTVVESCVKIVYPVFDKNKKLGKILNDSLYRRFAFWNGSSDVVSLEKFADDCITQSKIANPYNEVSLLGSYYDITIKVLNNTKNILTLSYALEAYGGGPHGSFYLYYDNYDRTTNHLIQLDDMLKDKKDKGLLKLSETYFKIARNIPQNISLKEDGAFFENDIFGIKDGEFYFNNAFTLNKDFLIFFYSDYEISCYAYGSTELRIPLEEVRPYLKNSYGF